MIRPPDYPALPSTAPRSFEAGNPECILKQVELKPIVSNSIGGEENTEKPTERHHRPQHAVAPC